MVVNHSVAGLMKIQTEAMFAAHSLKNQLCK